MTVEPTVDHGQKLPSPQGKVIGFIEAATEKLLVPV